MWLLVFKVISTHFFVYLKGREKKTEGENTSPSTTHSPTHQGWAKSGPRTPSGMTRTQIVEPLPVAFPGTSAGSSTGNSATGTGSSIPTLNVGIPSGSLTYCPETPNLYSVGASWTAPSCPLSNTTWIYFTLQTTLQSFSLCNLTIGYADFLFPFRKLQIRRSIIDQLCFYNR